MQPIRIKRKIQPQATGVPLNNTNKQVKRAVTNDPVYLVKQLEKIRTTEIYPVDAPGLPMLGPKSNFVVHATLMANTYNQSVKKNKGDQDPSIQSAVYEVVKLALREYGFTMPVETGSFRSKEVKFLPGHVWTDAIPAGPRPAKVMIINKTPWRDELNKRRALVGEDGVLLCNLFNQYKFNFSKAYVTHLIKFTPPEAKASLRASWLKDGLHLLMQEIKIVQPDYILCLGTEVSKALFGSDANTVNTTGRVLSLTYNTAFTEDQIEATTKTAKVVVATHPKQVVRDKSMMRQLEADINRFCGLVHGHKVGEEEQVDHRMLSTDQEVIEALVAIEQDEEKEDSVIAVDAEWHGEHPINAGSYMRFMQLSWKPQHAIAIKFHEQGGALNEEITSLTKTALLAFFKGKSFEYVQADGSLVKIKFRRKRVVGQFFNADLEWLIANGIDIQQEFLCPLNDIKCKDVQDPALRSEYQDYGFGKNDIIPAWFRTKFEGGADTGLMAHAIEETANFKLEVLAMRYTSAPRYDMQLHQWKNSFCKEQGIKEAHLEGYGECPDEILCPYGCYDADVTLRLFYKLDGLLDEDYEGNCCREAFWEAQIATPAVLDIHLNGITVDKNRIDFLTSKFLEAKNALEKKIRQDIRWPKFNIRSLLDFKELLFGEEIAKRLDKETGQPKRGRPPEAICLHLKPIFDTSKPPKLWKDLAANGQTADASPSTNKQALALLAQDNADNNLAFSVLNNLRDYRFLDQVLKTILRPPLRDEATEEELRDDDGNFEYEDGLASMLCDDGKVRTHIYQTKETGRWASARPNLQNISKQRDPDYKRLLGTNYKYTLRSVLKASPGYVLIEADYVGAELFGMAVMSGDKTMIDHATRNQLPEEHPDFYDIHSNIAVYAFKLKCPPTKQGLESIGKKHLRIVAKAVVFGVAYGRQAKAIMVSAKEQGVQITIEEAQQVIDSVYAMYPGLVPFFAECRSRATGTYQASSSTDKPSANYLCNCFGRFRRFPETPDMSVRSEFERQAMNYPLQSMIASAVSRAMGHMAYYRLNYEETKKKDCYFRFLLQIHDAILFEVRHDRVKYFCETFLPKYMRRSVPIYPTNLDGIPLGTGPYYLGLSAEIMEHWGEKLTHARATELGLPTGHNTVDGCTIEYSKALETKDVRSVELTKKNRKTLRNIKAPEYKKRK